VSLRDIIEQEIRERLTAATDKHMAEKEERATSQVQRFAEKSILLQLLDREWKDHLLALDHLRHGIGLRAYGQRDPLNEYKREAFELFEQLLDVVKMDVTRVLMTVRIQSEEEVTRAAEAIEERAEHISNVTYTHPNDDGSVSEELGKPSSEATLGSIAAGMTATLAGGVPKVGRNDPCPCGSGKKYKHCHGKLA